MRVEAGFDFGHQGFVVVAEPDYAGAGCSNCMGSVSMCVMEGARIAAGITLGHVDVVAREAVAGEERGVHVDFVLGISVSVTLDSSLGVKLTDTSTSPSAFSSDSRLSRSFMRSSRLFSDPLLAGDEAEALLTVGA